MRDSKIEQENFYKAAKFYLKKGFSIFPVAYGTKRPIVEWRRFCQRRISAEEVDDWWGRELYNIGVVCGQISGIVVMDVDDLEKFKRFCERHGLKLPSACPVVKTRRGLHVYAKYPADTEITNSTSAKLRALKFGATVILSLLHHPFSEGLMTRAGKSLASIATSGLA
jgi:hypothetical protein